MILSGGFSPRDRGSFLWTCGAYRQWDRALRGGEWWWELGADWGQGMLQGIVLPARPFVMTARVDLSSPRSGSAYWSWVTDVLSHRLGVDGLPFECETQVSVSVSREALSVAGRCTECGPDPIRLPAGRLEAGPVTLQWDFRGNRTTFLLDGEPMATCTVRGVMPGLLLVGGLTAGSPEACVRFGEVRIETASGTP